MKVYCYKSNIYSLRGERLLYIMATSKATALKFAEQFKGVLIGERLKSIDFPMFDTSDALMHAQAVNLQKFIDDKQVLILDTDLKLK